MKVKALRGVCVGVGRNLKAGDLADLDPGTVNFLVSIKAVEIVKEAPIEPDPPKTAENDDSKKEADDVKDEPQKKPQKSRKKSTK